MKSRGNRSGWVIASGVVAVLLAVALVSVLLASRLATTSDRLASRQRASTEQAASRLPGDACPLSTYSLPVEGATRIDAKLVAFDVAMASDPYFPFRGSTLATASRSQGPIRVANYFWVIAAAGTFQWDFPRPPLPGGGPITLHYLVEYFPADRCGIDGGVSITGLGEWPSWFESMRGLAEATIK
jgi:hypothetical protein